MNTQVAREIATARTQVMQDFVAEYIAEWQGAKITKKERWLELLLVNVLFS